MKSVFNSVYDPRSIKSNLSNDLFYKESGYKYFSMGRHALFGALKELNLNKEDIILIPKLICRDVLCAINECGALYKYYDVDESLNPVNLPIDENIKAIVYVNYFGFSSNHDVIRKYCEDNNCISIEDNAHGLLSKSPNGKYLGLIGDLGVFSFRKTLPINDGALLTINTNKVQFSSDHNYNGEESIYENKSSLRKLSSNIGVWIVRLLTFFIRALRKVRTGSYFPLESDNEKRIEEENRNISYDNLMMKVDIQSESLRRRKLYEEVENLLNSSKITKVFKSLDENCVPYAFPFYCDDSEIESVKSLLASKGLECFDWPSLPKDVEKEYKSKKVWLVRFLW